MLVVASDGIDSGFSGDSTLTGVYKLVKLIMD